MVTVGLEISPGLIETALKNTVRPTKYNKVTLESEQDASTGSDMASSHISTAGSDGNNKDSSANGSDQCREEVTGSDMAKSDWTDSNSKKWFGYFIPEEAEKLARQVESGVSSLSEGAYEKLLNGWKEAPVHIAVTGYRGTGKSSLINTIRGVKKGEKEFAATGVTETTMEPTPYRHTKHENIVLWDLPGYGTKTFREIFYMEMLELGKYDFYFICISNMFAFDQDIIEELIKSGKVMLYILRTCIDQPLTSERNKDGTSNTEDVLKTIRQDIETRSKQIVEDINEKSNEGKILPRVKIFLLSNLDIQSYDYPLFVESLIDDAPKGKERTLIRSLFIVSEAQIKRKADNLLADVWKFACYSVATLAKKTQIKVGDEMFSIALQPLLDAAGEYRALFQFTDEQLDVYYRVASLPKTIQDFFLYRYRTENDIIQLLEDQTNIDKAMEQDISKYPFYVKLLQVISKDFKLAGFVLTIILNDYKSKSIEALRYIKRVQSQV